jgi:peptidoglycan/LPS O-acetylase OafA/YrhL
MLVVSTFLPLYEITNGQQKLREINGLDHHSVAMLLLGVAAALMAFGALRGARPAMLALAAIGIVVLVVAFTVDLPAALEEGVLAVTYEGAEAKPAIGFFVETLAGALLLVSGGLQLMRPRG